ncbi:MAG: hypothetical protein M9887_00535 [Chitinophagales bacterium]|nr:hypothetical protein [Chitinophagales bacterium]
MKNSSIILTWIYELVWFVAAILFVAFFTWNLYSSLEKSFFYYIATTMFLAFNLFRWIAFPRYSPLMYSFVFKAIMLIANIFMFVYILKDFQDVMNVFNSFNFTNGWYDTYLIKENVSLENIMKIKSTTIASVVSYLILCILFEFRAVQLIFRWRQVPDYLLNKD